MAVSAALPVFSGFCVVLVVVGCLPVGLAMERVGIRVCRFYFQLLQSSLEERGLGFGSLMGLEPQPHLEIIIF